MNNPTQIRALLKSQPLLQRVSDIKMTPLSGGYTDDGLFYLSKVRALFMIVPDNVGGKGIKYEYSIWELILSEATRVLPECIDLSGLDPIKGGPLTVRFFSKEHLVGRLETYNLISFFDLYIMAKKHINNK